MWVVAHRQQTKRTDLDEWIRRFTSRLWGRLWHSVRRFVGHMERVLMSIVRVWGYHEGQIKLRKNAVGDPPAGRARSGHSYLTHRYTVSITVCNGRAPKPVISGRAERWLTSEEVRTIMKGTKTMKGELRAGEEWTKERKKEKVIWLARQP